MRPVEKLLPRLNKVRQTGKDKWIACCPAHDDRTPSMTIKELDDGTVLLRDWGGCSFEDVMDAVGLKPREMFPPKPQDRKALEEPFPCKDILRAVSRELLIVLMGVEAVNRGDRVLLHDLARLHTAAERIQKAIDISGVRT